MVFLFPRLATFEYQKNRGMSKDQTLQTLRKEVERIQHSLDRITAMPEVNLAEIYVAKKSAAQFLGISYRTIERWQRLGYVEGFRVGGRVYFMKAELMRVAKVYSAGIRAVSNANQPQSLSELLSRHINLIEN